MSVRGCEPATGAAAGTRCNAFARREAKNPAPPVVRPEIGLRRRNRLRSPLTPPAAPARERNDRRAGSPGHHGCVSPVSERQTSESGPVLVGPSLADVATCAAKGRVVVGRSISLVHGHLSLTSLVRSALVASRSREKGPPQRPEGLRSPRRCSPLVALQQDGPIAKAFSAGHEAAIFLTAFRASRKKLRSKL